MNRIPIATTVLMGMLLCACDKLQQQGPPPTYQSSALESVRAANEPAANAPSAPASATSKP